MAKYRYIIEFDLMDGEFTENDIEQLRSDLIDTVESGFDDVYSLTVKIQDEDCMRRATKCRRCGKNLPCSCTVGDFLKSD